MHDQNMHCTKLALYYGNDGQANTALVSVLHNIQHVSASVLPIMQVEYCALSPLL